jgi:hypothetical protein
MAKHGLLELARGTNRIGVKAPTALATNYDISLPPALPIGTLGVQRDSAGQESYFQPIVNVPVLAPLNQILTSSQTPGFVNLSINNQNANLILASPVSGAAAAPTFRNLVVGDFGVGLPSLSDWAAPTTGFNLNNQRITNLAEPLTAQDGATKNYVDSTVQGFTVKLPVRAATTANIALTGLQAIDGIVLVAGNRVLVKNQTTASQNGIYTAATGAWTRSTDADSGTEISSAMYLFVQEGTQNADSGWILATDGTITIGTTALNFSQFTGVGAIIGGSGLTKTGNQLDVVGTPGRIVANADSIDLATNGVVPGTYNSVTVDAYGRVTLGADLVQTKVFRLGFTNTALSSGILTINHNIGTQFCQIQIFDNNNKRIEADDYTATSSTTMTVDLTAYGTISGTWWAVIVG